MSVEETLLFLDLCWPVVDRALALCYGKPGVEVTARP